MIRLAAIVSDSALKKAPVTPERNASGAKMIIVAADEPISGRVNSAAASRTAPLGASVFFSLIAADNVLSHHNRIIDNESDSCGQPAQRHNVEAHLEHIEKEHRRAED